MEFRSYLDTPYPFSRMPVMGRRGAVATSQPLAAQAGLTMLQQGGSAVDAVLATALALTVVEPTSNSLGADAFAIVWPAGADRPIGLNASGRAPAALSLKAVHDAGHTATMPERGWLPVTVPGAVSAWVALHERFGRLPFAAIFGPAIALAEEGFPVSPVVAAAWRRGARLAAQRTSPEFAGWAATFDPAGTGGPRAGDIVRLPQQASTLRTIAASRGAAFYEGDLARSISTFAEATGGWLRDTDLAAHTPTWVDPIHVDYRGYDVWEIPPNGQGITALMALNIVSGFDLPAWEPESVDAWHVQIEAIKLAFADAAAYVADPAISDVPVDAMLSSDYAAQRRALIGDSARVPEAGTPPKGGTVYLCAADGDGTMVSYIQSDYMGFGSGVVIPGTGIGLQNRGCNFSLVNGHPNVVAGGKRPYHTIIPGFLSRDGSPIGPFGVMGGFMQPQGHLQVVIRTLDQGRHPQAALDAPRFRWDEGLRVAVEPRTPTELVDGLRARGHDVVVDPELGGFGRGQIIWRIGDTLVAASESRADGQAVVW